MQTPDSLGHLPSEPESHPNADPCTFQNGLGEANPILSASYSSLEGGRGEDGGDDGIEIATPSLARSQVSGTTVNVRNESNIEDGERNGIEIAAAVLGQPQRVGEVPFYTGKLV